MTSIQLKINGQPFEIELHDGVQVSVEDGKMVVRNGSKEDAPTTRCGIMPWDHVAYHIFGDDAAFVVSV